MNLQGPSRYVAANTNAKKAAALCFSAFMGGNLADAFSSTTTRPFYTTTTTATILSKRTRTNAAQPWSSSLQRPPRRQGLDSSSSRRTSPLYMNWLQNFFGGGAYNQRFDYSVLDFPAPELAQLAIENKNGAMPPNSPSQPNLEMATFAGGCFWGLELAFQRIPGVAYTTVGYTGGMEAFPTYDQVGAGNTGHTEAVCVYYDPQEGCDYETLLDTFFERVDPTTVNGQGRDYGRQYRTGVYYHSEEQEQVARDRFVVEQARYTRPIATECKRAASFWPAEEYHQRYLEKGGRFGQPQSSQKGCTDEIRCYG